MQAAATFSIKDFKPTGLTPTPAIATALPVSVATMEKRYAGDIEGRSAPLFTAAFDPAGSTCTYLAMESFEGTVNGQAGTFNFVHSAATAGSDRRDEFFAIVAGSGTGKLTGIAGAGGLRIDADGTHHLWLDYQLPAAAA